VRSAGAATNVAAGHGAELPAEPAIGSGAGLGPGATGAVRGAPVHAATRAMTTVVRAITAASEYQRFAVAERGWRRSAPVACHTLAAPRPGSDGLRDRTPRDQGPAPDERDKPWCNYQASCLTRPSTIARS